MPRYGTSQINYVSNKNLFTTREISSAFDRISGCAPASNSFAFIFSPCQQRKNYKKQCVQHENNDATFDLKHAARNQNISMHGKVNKMWIILSKRNTAKQNSANAVPKEMNENRRNEAAGILKHGGNKKTHEHDIGAGQPASFERSTVTKQEKRCADDCGDRYVKALSQALIEITAHKELLHDRVEKESDEPNWKLTDTLYVTHMHPAASKEDRSCDNNPTYSDANTDQS